MKSEKINLVVGAGFSGATLARKLAEDCDEKVLVIDRKSHLAGNCHDRRDENGIMIHTYGSHIFHTDNEEVWRFVRRFASFNTYQHRVVAIIDGIETTIPFNFNTLRDVFPATLAHKIEEKLLAKFPYGSKIPILALQKESDPDLQFLATYIYEKVFLHYTTKQWGVKPTDVDGAVTARVPVFLSRDNRYFQNKYQGIPLDGYTKLIERMLTHPNITIQLKTDFQDLKMTPSRVFFTGAIDEYFNYCFGELPYRSVKFEYETYAREFYQSNAVVNYPCNYDFTRIHEYKHYLNDVSDKTVIAKEYSEAFVRDKNERMYPIPSDASRALLAKYLEKASTLKDVFFLGRLGDYRYYDMDQAIARALALIPLPNTSY